MDKIRNCIYLLVLILSLTNCAPGGYWNDIDAEISINPTTPVPGTDITVKCSNYDIFDYDTIAWEATDNCDETAFYNDCFSIKQNILSDNRCIYGANYSNGSLFKEKKSNREAVYSLTSNAVSCYIYHDGIFMRKSTADGCDKNDKLFDDVNYNIEYLHLSYPSYLSLDKTTAKIGDKVTITSSKPFFDESTLNDKKLARLFASGYIIVWYSGNVIIQDPPSVYAQNMNIDKLPLPNTAIDLDSLTPTSVTFTIPDDAITGTIHVLNEGGFVVDGTNDIGLVGNVEGAYAYYSTAAELTIMK